MSDQYDRPLDGVEDPPRRDDVVGFCTATTSIPFSSSNLMTRRQLEPSAHAPWTSTTVGLCDEDISMTDFPSDWMVLGYAVAMRNVLDAALQICLFVRC